MLSLCDARPLIPNIELTSTPLSASVFAVAASPSESVVGGGGGWNANGGGATAAAGGAAGTPALAAFRSRRAGAASAPSARGRPTPTAASSRTTTGVNRARARGERRGDRSVLPLTRRFACSVDRPSLSFSLSPLLSSRRKSFKGGKIAKSPSRHVLAPRDPPNSLTRRTTTVVHICGSRPFPACCVISRTPHGDASRTPDLRHAHHTEPPPPHARTPLPCFTLTSSHHLIISSSHHLSICHLVP